MAVNISGIRRNLKNVAHNYTDAQVKVREATSNDPWGPSSTMMSEIADLTYNVVAFSEIMQMIWKRLNDHGKNWRHVYKALVLLEYLIKTGSEKVAQQCKENIYAIQTLKDFQYLDDNKDQGINVREKAKALVALLKDDERLKNERVRALKAKERFAQSTAGIGSDTVYNHTRERHEAAAAGHIGGTAGGVGSGQLRSTSSDYDVSNPEIEAARPQTVGEEELQLQLALAMSREEAEQEESKTQSDDLRLKMALEKSKKDEEEASISRKQNAKPSNDLLDLDFGNPSAAMAPATTISGPPMPSGSSSQPPPPQRTAASTAPGGLDPWGMPAAPSGHAQPSSSPQPDAWGVPALPPAAGAAQNDPWGAAQPGAAAAASAAGGAAAGASGAVVNDPWSPVGAQPRASPLQGAFGGAGGMQQAQMQQSEAKVNDPWQAVSSSPAPLGSDLAAASAAGSGVAPSLDLFSPQAQNQLAEFDLLRGEIEKNGGGPGAGHQHHNNGGGGSNGNGGSISPNPFDLNDMGSNLQQPMMSSSSTTPTPGGLGGANGGAIGGAKPKKSVQTLLGEHSKLVNLDNLVSESSKTVRNPFEQQAPNPFQAKTQKPPMKDLINQQNNPAGWDQAQNPQPQEEMNPFF